MLISTITSKLRKATTNDVIVALERLQVEKELYFPNLSLISLVLGGGAFLLVICHITSKMGKRLLNYVMVTSSI